MSRAAADISTDRPSPPARPEAGAEAALGPFLASVGMRQLAAFGRGAPAVPGCAEQVLDLVPAAVFACAPDGAITFFNRRAAELWRREPPLHVPGENFCAGQKFLAADGTVLPPEQTPLAQASREGRSCRGLGVCLQRPDGSVYEASLDVDPLRDDAGHLCGAIVILHETTAVRRRDRATALLTRIHEEMANLASEAEVISVATRLVGEHFEVDRCAFFEADETRGELQIRDGWRRPGLPPMGSVLPAGELVEPDAWRLLRRGPVAIEDVATHPLTARTAAALATLGLQSFALCRCSVARPPSFILGVASTRPRAWAADELSLLENIAARVWPLVERTRAEAELRRQQRELQLICATAPAILSHWDCNHRLVFASRAFAERWRLQPEDCAGRTMTQIFGPAAFARLQPFLERVLAGETLRFELEVPYQDIGDRYVQASYAPEVDDHGTVRGYLAAVIDLTDRRRAEIALFESEQRLRLASRTGKVGLWDWDCAANRLTWTESLFEIHGIRPTDFDPTIEGFLALVHLDDRAPVQRALQSAIEHDTRFELELRAVRPGGSVIWLFTNATIVRENNRPVRVVGATLDITARKTTELALRESESRFRVLASHAPVGIFLTDPKGDCVFVNESWRAMAGLTAERARGRGWVEALHPDDRARVLREWYEGAAARRPFASEYRFLRPDGRVVWLQGSAVESRGANGVLTGFLGTIVDITERKAAEDALRVSEKRFRTLASHAPVGIFLTDAAGDTVFVNEAWTAMAGASPEQARGRGWSGAIHPDDRLAVMAGWEAAFTAGVPINAEYRFLHPDGRIVWVQGNAVPVRDAAGNCSGYIGTVADITQRKAIASELEHKVAERTASLREAVAQMEEFSYSVSHDLRGPLRAMNAYAEALMEDYGDGLDETARTYLERIRRNSRRMEALTHDVLTYNQVARAEIELRPVNLETLLHDVIAEYPELRPDVVDLRVVGPLGLVRAHEPSLGQCLAHLLANAAKFVAPGVRPQIVVRAERGDGRVRLWIEDNGIGIAPEQQSALFRVFERIPTPQPYDGTGIGLATVRKAMDKMGGRCGVVSDGRHGSQFWIELAAV